MSMSSVCTLMHMQNEKCRVATMLPTFIAETKNSRILFLKGKLQEIAENEFVLAAGSAVVLFVAGVSEG
jgi:hypothetical protein